MRAENRTRRKKVYDNSTLRVSSQFEHVKNEMSTQTNESLNDEIAHVLARADSASRRRDRSSGSGRARGRTARGTARGTAMRTARGATAIEFVFIQETGQN